MDLENTSFYHILGVKRDAKLSVIRKAYYKLAVKLHPDKNENKEKATKDFQKLTLIKETLFDEKKRKYYDDTGEVMESGGNFDSSYEYWRERYAKVTVQDIEKFKKTYKKSKDEEDDLLDAYKKCKGDMQRIMEFVPLAEPDDIDRFVEYLEGQIASGSLKKYRVFKTSIKKLSREEDLSEAKEAEEMAKKLGIKQDNETSLHAMILARKRQRQHESSSFLANLEAKYAKPSKGKKKKGKKAKK